MVRTWPPNYLLRGGVNKTSLRTSRALGHGLGGGASGIDTLFAASGTADSSGQADASTRNAIRIDGKMGPGQMVRVTFAASSAATFAVDNAAIGILSGAFGSGGATVATPIELKFAGASGFSISAGATITSDWLEFPGGFKAGQFFEVIIDYNAANGNPRIVGGLGATQAESATLAATNSFNSASALAGSTTVAGQTLGVTRIQVQ